MTSWFNVRKAAQVAAFFALKEKGTINVLKLTKLIYLSDRTFLESYDIPILYDQLVSMPHGPVNSLAYSYISGSCESDEWDEFLVDREKHYIGVSNEKLSEGELDELSRAELNVLNFVWEKFGHMDRFEIRDYTHDNCPEWEDPNGSSSHIPYSRLLKYLNKANVDDLEDRIISERQVTQSFLEPCDAVQSAEGKDATDT